MKTSILASVGTCVILAAGAALMAPSSPHAQAAAPRYEFDASWNRPFPNRWINGGLGGLCVDANDHVLVLNRQDVNKPELAAGAMAPPMLEFDSAGNLVHSWGDPKLIDPRLHSCHYDKDGNVWIASAPSGMVQKYSHDGSKLLLTIGKKGVYDTSDGTEKGKPLNSPTAAFHMPSSIFVDPGNGDVYIADGENDTSNSKIAVFDKMGKLQRTFDVPSMSVTPSADGKPIDGGGAAVAIDFSRDREQRYMFV